MKFVEIGLITSWLQINSVNSQQAAKIINDNPLQLSLITVDSWNAAIGATIFDVDNICTDSPRPESPYINGY